MKKQKTFADRAKEIKKKFPRAEWDKIERKDMMAALAKLRDEQEEFKTAMGIANDADQMDAEEQGEPQGVPEEEEGEEAMGGHFIRGNMGSTYARGGGLKYYDGYGDSKLSLGNLGGMNSNVNQSGFSARPSNTLMGTNNQFKAPAQFQSPTDSFLPFAISGAASLIGDIAGLSNINKNMPSNLNMPRVAPQNISLQAQREGLQRGYNTASNIALKNSRDVSNPANAYANQVAGLSALTDSYGTQMGQSWMAEANANRQAGMEASQMNAQLASREAMGNMELQSQKAQMKAPYINSLAQTVPSMFRDYRQQVNDTNMINNMGKDYGQYEQVNPNEKPIDRILAQMFGRRTYTLNKLDPRIR
jgi:hypothetical protein